MRAKNGMSESGRILVVFGLLCLLLLGLFLVRGKREKAIEQAVTPTKQSDEKKANDNASEITAEYRMEPSPLTIKSGADAWVTVVLDAPQARVDGTDILLSLDPQYLSVEEIITGDWFTQYPRQQIDRTSGKIAVTGFVPKNSEPMEGDVPVLRMRVRAQMAGTTQISWDFRPGTTDRTTVVETGTSRNILRRVTPITVSIGI